MEKPSSGNNTQMHLLTVTPPAHPNRHFTYCCKALIILFRGISLLYLSRYFIALQMLPKAILAVVCLFFSRFLVPSYLLCVAANAVV